MSLGRGVDLKDSEEVKEYLENLGIEYRFGCYHEKNPTACHLLGDYMEAVKKDFHKAFKIFETNCLTNGNGHSCHKAGAFKFQGKGCSRDEEEGYEYFVKGCEGGYAYACANAGIINSGLRTKGTATLRFLDKVKALEYFKKACDEGNVSEACHRYSVMRLSGEPNLIEKNLQEAFSYAQKSCHLGKLDSCVNLSIMYKKGDGVEKDESLSEKYANYAREIAAQERGDRGTLNFGGKS